MYNIGQLRSLATRLFGIGIGGERWREVGAKMSALATLSGFWRSISWADNGERGADKETRTVKAVKSGTLLVYSLFSIYLCVCVCVHC